MQHGLLSVEELDRLEAHIDTVLEELVQSNPAIDTVERGEAGERRWYVRVLGEEKSVYTLWLTLGQRDLHFETYVMPAPETNAARLYEHLLRRNLKLRGLAFAIGAEDAVYLVGADAAASVDAATIDQILGSVHEAVELCFRPAMRIGFEGRFTG